MFPFVLILSASFPTPPGEAELLLREVDAKITAANSLRIEFEIRDGSGGKGKPLIQGSVVLADRNRFRHEVELPTLDSRRRSAVISDGKRLGSVGQDRIAPPLPKLPAWHNEVLRSWLGRGGTYLSAAAVFDHASREGGAKPG